jgi:hypothetical protein
MHIENFKIPFHHTIIYDYFTDWEINQIFNEKNYLMSKGDPLQYIESHDEHHKNLITNENVITYRVDTHYQGEREKSAILNLIKKIYSLNSMGFLNYNENPYLKYISASNSDETYINVYKNESYYSKHPDKSVLSMVYVLWEGFGNFSGGNLFFEEYNYSPYLLNNCCIIFPSYEVHEVKKLLCDETLSRFTINQRIYCI